MFSIPLEPWSVLAMTILVIVAIAVIALLAYAATRADTFRIERSTSINAVPDAIFSLLTDFRRWAEWSPWEKLDPDLKRTHSGATDGKGAVYAWEGNKKVGAGRMEITQVVPPSRVVIKLDFLRPFEAHNVTEFTLAAGGTATRVIWAMTGVNNFMGKLMSVFMNMDKMVGKDFETGLANLKAVAEK